MKITKQNTSKPLIVISALIVVIVALIYLAASLHLNKNVTSINNQIPSTIENQKDDKYLGWETYCSIDGGLCLRYPKNWTLDDSSSQYNTTITNTQKTISVVHVSQLNGVGGYCPPNNCFLRVLDVDNLNGAGMANLKVIKGIYINVMNNTFAIQYQIGRNDKIAFDEIKIGEKLDIGQLGPFVLRSPLNQDEFEQLYVKSIPDTGFNSEQDVVNWFAGSDAITAGDIISSIYAN